MKRSILSLASAALTLNLLGSGALWAAANAPLKTLGDIAEGGPAAQKKFFDGGAPAAPRSDAVIPGGAQDLQGPEMDAAREREIQKLLKEPVPTPRVCKERGENCCGEHRPDQRRDRGYSSWRISFTGWNIFGAIVGAVVGGVLGFLVAGPVGAVAGAVVGGLAGGFLGGVFR